MRAGNLAPERVTTRRQWPTNFRIAAASLRLPPIAPPARLAEGRGTPNKPGIQQFKTLYVSGLASGHN